MDGRLSQYVETAGRVTGRFLSSFTYVLTTLLVYAIICLLTYVFVRLTLGPNEGASFVTFEIATGGDPFNFKELAVSHPILWIWLLLVHSMSWLIVPVLAATAVDAAFRQWEDRKSALEVELGDEMSRVLERHVKVPKEEASRIAQEFLTEASKRITMIKKKS